MKVKLPVAPGAMLPVSQADWLSSVAVCVVVSLFVQVIVSPTLALMVVGSKAMVGSNDQRPLFRRVATRVYNGLLRVTCHFDGTDTHGLKAFRREALLETARRCVLDRDVFASEFVVRAHREKKKVVEIPFAVREKRPPSINLIKRVPHVLKSVARLAISVRRNET